MPGSAPKRGLSFLAAALKTKAPMDIHSDIAEALHALKPAVAPESITTTHDMRPTR